jgi:ABC-2 type transport system permease protein
MDVKAVKINWPYMVTSLGYPLSLLFVVAVLSGGHLIDFALVGGVISAVAINGITALSYIASLKFDYAYQDLLMTTRTSKMDYMIAHLLGEVIWIAPGVILFIILDIFYKILTIPTLVALLLLAGMVSLATYSIAFWFSGILKHTRNAPAIGTLLSLFMITVSPTFYPYTYLPKTALYILSIFPTTPAVVLAQGLFHLEPMQWYMLPILIIEVCIYFTVAVKLTKWKSN